MIKMIKREMKKPASESEDEDTGSGDESEEHAGKQFGRRAHKRAKKTKH